MGGGEKKRRGSALSLVYRATLLPWRNQLIANGLCNKTRPPTSLTEAALVEFLDSILTEEEVKEAGEGRPRRGEQRQCKVDVKHKIERVRRSSSRPVNSPVAPAQRKLL